MLEIRLIKSVFKPQLFSIGLFLYRTLNSISMKITPIKFLLLFFFCSGYTTAQTPYSFTENWKVRNYTWETTFANKTLSASSSPNATISVETATVVAPVLPTQFGVNTTFRNGNDQRSRASLYDGVVTTLRFPAGSGSNLYFWDGNAPSTFKPYIDKNNVVQTVSPINALNSANMTPSTFIQFKNDVNGQAIVVVNYFYARYGITTTGTRAARVQQAANYAAAFVRKLNIDLGGKVKYWEIGNEIYGKWEAGYNMADATIGTVTGKEYGEDFRVFAQAMKAVDPTIKIGAVVTEEDDAWNAGVLPEIKNHADFLSVHEYFTSVNDATPANILASIPMIGTIMTTLRTCITKYTGKPADYFPIALTEFNARGPYNGSMMNGVFITQILGEVIKNKFGLSALWVSEWNWDGTTQDVKAFLAKNDPDQDDYTARPAYLPFYYYGKCFGDNMVQATSSNAAVKVYASTFSSGEVGVVLINPTSTAKTVKLLVNKNGQPEDIDKLQWYELYANTIEPTVSGYKKFYVNGQTATTTGGGPDLNNVKPYQTTYSVNNVFNMLPYSVFFVVAQTNNLTTISDVDTNNSERRIIPFLITDHFNLSEAEKLIKVEIFSHSGKLLSSNNSEYQNISQLPLGLYILKATFTDKLIVNRFYKG